jgi:O-Antigen ligase
MGEEPDTEPPPASVRPDQLRRSTAAAVALLLMALGYAVFAQGGFYAGRFRWLLVLVAAGLAAAFAARRPFPRDLRHPMVALAVAVAMWSVVSATLAGHPRGAGPALGLVFSIAAVVLIVNRLAGPDRSLLEAGVLALGVLVALDGWYGVAWHARPAALPDQGLWRAASPITYANGTAGLLVPLALFALARRSEHPGRIVPALTAFILLGGAAATLSRAGGIALLAGLAVIVAGATVVGAGGGALRLIRDAIPIMIGAAIAVAGLLPSVVDGAPARPLLAGAGALLGAVVVAVFVRWPDRPFVYLVGVGGVVAVAVVLSLHPSRLSEAFDRIRAARLTASSTDRTDEWRATLRLVHHRPVAGIGPGQFVLLYRASSGHTVTERFAHNEYLQLLAEEGAIGLLVLTGGLVLTSLALVRSLRAKPFLATGALGALAALLVHSSFDYLWHIPAVVLLPLALVALPLSPADC